jgi:rhomboid family GlyGly-CTERM serine protease
LAESGTAAAPAASGARHWLLLGSVAGVGALLAWPLPSALIDWQPERALQLWRWWTAAWVHWSELHLAANLGATLVVMAYGWAARLPAAAALAWLLAWPLTHGALLLQPALAHYGGLSGLLHAGVAVATLWLLVEGRGGRRIVGALMALMLAAKIVSEAPWGEPLRQAAGWDVALAPVAHASGTIAGLACAAAVLAWRKNRR